MSHHIIAYFITPHGFGHASRAAAVMAAVQTRAPHVRFELFTTCPKQIFSQSLTASFGYHAVHVDIGVVQTTPLKEDLPATCRALDGWLPFDPDAIAQTAQHLKRMRCTLAVCDISPFGIVAAAEAGMPSLLFVIPGANGLAVPQHNVIMLPTHSAFFHPDLALAADLVIGKVGYSTLSEIYQAGTPFGYIPRPASPESDPLVDFIKYHMAGRPVSAQAYNSGRWIDQLPQLLSLPRSHPQKRNGADQAAEFILDLIRSI